MHSTHSHFFAPITCSNKKLALSKITLACLAVFYVAQAQSGSITQQVKFNSVGQSMWSPGQSTAFSNLNDPLFLGTTWNESGSILKIGDPTLGGNGVSVSGSTSGKVGLELGWKVDSGTINTSLPFNFTLDTPDRNQLVSGNTFSFGVSQASLDSNAFLRSVSPTIQAYADLILEAKASVTAKGCYDVVFDQGCSAEKTVELFDIDNSGGSFGRELLSVNIDGADRSAGIADGQIRVLHGFSSILEAGSTVADLIDGSPEDEKEKKKKAGIDDSGNPDNSAPPPKKGKVSVIPKPGVSGGLSALAEVSVRLPDIDTVASAGSDKTIGNNGRNDVISSSASDEFLSVAFDVDTAGTLLGIVPQLGIEGAVDFGIGSVGGSFDLIDLTLTPAFSLTQDLSIAINDISVAYEFSDGQSKQFASSLTDKVDVLWTGSPLSITPVYNIDVSVTNSTGLSVDFDFSLDLLKGTIGAEVLGFDLGNKSFGPLASLDVDLGGFAFPSIFDSTFDLGGFSEMKGADVNISISQAQFKSGKGDWESSSSWNGISGKPNSTTDVQLGQTGSGAFTSHAEIDDCSTFCATDQSEVVGNVTIKQGSRLDIGGRSYTFNSDDDIANRLTVKGNKVDNDGAIYVYTKDKLSFSTASPTSITGTGFIGLQDGGILNTSGSGRANVNMSGHDISVSTNINKSNINKIDGLNLNMSGGAKILMDSNSRLELNFSSVVNNSATQTLVGQTWLNNADLINFDNGNVLNVTSTSQRSNFSTWGAGADGRLLNNGNVTVTANSQSSNLSLSSGKSESGIGTVLRFTNNDQVKINGSSGTTRLTMTSDVTELSGNGEISLLGNFASINSDNANNRLFNGEDHTIVGRGSITGFRNNAGGLVNDGLISAQGGILDLTDSRVTNNGVMRAQGGSQLKLDATDMTQVSFTSGGGLFNGYDRMTMSGGVYSVDNGGTINFHTGNEDMERFTNYAVLELNGSNANITLTDTASFLGGSTTRNIDELSQFNNRGTLKLVNHQFAEDDVVNFFDANEFNNFGNVFLSGNSRIKGVSNKTGGLIEGHGTIEGGGDLIGGQLINQGTIRATGIGQTLRLELPDSIVSTWRNEGRVEVMNGANLLFVDGGLDSFFSGGDTFSGGGTWAAYAGNQITNILFDAGSAFGGGVSKLDNVELILSGNNARFFTVSNGQSKGLKDTLTTINSSATLALENGKNFAVATNTLTNNGTIRLDNSFLSGNAVTNNGQINGSGALQGSTLTNNGLVRAQNGFLDIQRNINNQNGVIAVGSGNSNASGQVGDVLRLNNRTITGGELIVKENALFQGIGALNDIKLTNRGDIITSANFNSLRMNLSDGSTNSGKLGADNGGLLTLSGESLDNSGGVISADNARVRLNNITIVSGEVEIVGGQAALRGYGSLDNVEIKVVGGSIIADVAGQRLTLDPSSAARLINATLSAENGGILLLTDGDFNGAGGTMISASNGSIVELKNVTMSGAELMTFGSGKFVDVASSNFNNMLFAGNVEVADTGEFNLNGINRLTGSLTATAGGEIVLHDSSLVGQVLATTTNPDGSTNVSTVVSPGDLILQAGSKLRGAGNLIDLNITNQGTIEADGVRALVIDNATDTFVNQGSLQAQGMGGIELKDTTVINKGSVSISESSQLTFADTLEQQSGATQVEGTMTGGTLIISDGTLLGNGEIFADVMIGESGMMQGYNGQGLSITGDVEMDGTLFVDVLSDTSFDVFSILGNFQLSSTSMFEFGFAGGFDLFDGLEISFLTASSFMGLTDFDFGNISFLGLTTDWKSSIGLSDDGLSLSLSFQKVPEPATLALMLFASMGIRLSRRKN